MCRRPGPGEVTIKNHACGLNFIDTYQRSGLYPVTMPSGLGLEAAGVVEAVGPGVTDFKPGDRVAYCCGTERRLCDLSQLSGRAADQDPGHGRFRHRGRHDAAGHDGRVPGAPHLSGEGRRFRAVPCRGRRRRHASPCNGCRSLGAVIIGTAGSPEKCAIAKSLGATHVINYRSEDWVKRVKDITDGKGVHVVYDGVGKDTFLPSLDCLRPRGMMVTFGNASGPAPEIQPLLLSQKGSLFLTRPTLFHYIASRADLELSASALFDVVNRGVVKIQIGHRYPLKDAARRIAICRPQDDRRDDSHSVGLSALLAPLTDSRMSKNRVR